MKNLKLKLLASLLFVFICALSSIQIVKITKEANEEVINEIEEFYKLTYPFYKESEKLKLKVGFGNLKENNLGVCYIGLGGPYITIDEKRWKKASQTQKKIIILHEMGHCICRLGHVHFFGAYPKLSQSETDNIPKDVSHVRTGFFPDYCPTTVMHPKILPDFCFKRHEQHYRYELLLRCREARNEL